LDIISYQLEELGLQHLSFQPMMLRRLTNDQSFVSLKTLIDVVSPLKEYAREGNAEKNGFSFQQYSPFTRVMDAAIPDPGGPRIINKLVDQYLKTKDGESFNKLKDILITLKINHSALEPIIKSSPILKEIEPLSKNLSDLSTIGIEALDLISKGKKAKSVWLENANAVLEESQKPYGQVEIVIVDAVQKLVEASK
jgi:hexosaminidase